MREQFHKPQDEFVAAYGGDEGVAFEPTAPQGEQEGGYEGEVGGKESEAQAFLERHSSEERKLAEDIVGAIEGISNQLESEHIVSREMAAESMIATAFAAAPTSGVEDGETSLWKSVLRGASLGARNAVKAVALTSMMSASPAFAQDYMHPSPQIQKKVDYLFGKNIFERFANKRASYKEAYTQLEMHKEEVQHRIDELNDPRPRSTAEEAHIKRVEADRDAKLAALRVERTLEKAAFEDLHTNDPTERAEYDARIAAIAAREARVVEDCEALLLAEHRKAAPQQELQDLYREIVRIEREENELVRRFYALKRSAYGSYWSRW